jgi:hypothetical protein
VKPRKTLSSLTPSIVFGAKKYPGEIEAGTVNDQRRPDVFTLLDLVGAKGNELLEDILAPKNRRAIPHRLNRCSSGSVETAFQASIAAASFGE